MYLIDIAYFFILILVAPFYFKKLLNKSERGRLMERFAPGKNILAGKSIWIHAVSVGEVRGLRTFVTELKKKYGYNIVMSVSTSSGYKSAKDIFGDITVISAPFDFTFVIRKFVKRINPVLLILNELEIWPNWVRLFEKSKIPVVLINGRISEKAYSRYQKFGFFFRSSFKRITRVMIQGEWYRERFHSLGIDNSDIRLCGSIKSDEAFSNSRTLPSKKEIRENLKLPLKKKILLFASTHYEDEKFFIPFTEKLSRDFFIIIAPRHPERSKEIRASILSIGTDAILYSEKRSLSKKCNVLLFDKIGYLMQLMKISDIIFMGGGMSPSTGGHNLYEPAVLGKSVIGGPYLNNFPDIGSSLVKEKVYTVVSEEEDLSNAIKRVLKESGDVLSEKAISEVNRRRGAVKCILSEIGEFLK